MLIYEAGGAFGFGSVSEMISQWLCVRRYLCAWPSPATLKVWIRDSRSGQRQWRAPKITLTPDPARHHEQIVAARELSRPDLNRDKPKVGVPTR
jgi:hypothetical protein